MTGATNSLLLGGDIDMADVNVYIANFNDSDTFLINTGTILPLTGYISSV